MEKQPHNITPKNTDLEVLKTHFPQCFTKEGNFDFEKFKAELSSQDIDFSHESYRLDWLGKSYARLLATDKTTTFLTEDVTHNNLPENQNSENILIKGDNLEVLKHLSNAYHSKIKMIYIDPPYNTGSDGFVYQDDRKFTAEQLQTLAGISPSRAERILEFTQSKSNSHSAWLTFMYPRLYIAKRLLTDNGVIFISIDDNEVAQLRLLCDEIFGEENFVAEFPRITKKAGKTTDLVAKNTDYLLLYSKTNNVLLNKIQFEDDKYNGEDEYLEERGNYKLSQTLDYGSIQYSPSLDYEIELEGKIFRPGNVSKEKMEERQKANPKSDFCWRWSKELFQFGLENDFIVVKNDRIYTKTYKNATISKNKKGYFIDFTERKKSISSLEFIENKYSNDNAKKDLSKYFDEKVFEYSKPISLISKIIDFTTDNELLNKIIDISTQKEDIILDFFAGSGTTADAVMQLNREDGGNRKFILVQLPEPIDPKKSKTAYDFVKNELGVAEPTIFDITKERIIRSSKQNAVSDKPQKEDLFSEEEPTAYGIQPNTSTGFKIFATTPIWDNYEEEYENFDPQIELFDPENITEEDIATLLTTWKTYDGIPLTTSLEKVDLGGYTAYYGQEKLYLMDKKFATENLKNLVEKIDNDTAFNPISVVIFGHHFESKAIRELTENLKNYSNKKQSENNISVVARY